MVGRATMAKARGRPKREDRPEDAPIRMDRALVSMVKAIADARGLSAVQVLSDLAREPIRRAYAQLLREFDPEGGKGKGKG